MRSQHDFSQTPSVSVPRSTFNLSHGHKTTFDADYLIPIMAPLDIIPGSTINMQTSFFMRLATPLAPILDNLYFETFAFFVPYRTIWDNHEKFHGAQDDPNDSISFTIPTLAAGSAMSTGDLGDYFGLPISLNTTNNTGISALPFRAYKKIYNDWFRSATLQDTLVVPTDNGPDSSAESGFTAVPLIRGKRFDYFTSCLPAPQRGTGVTLPLGTKADIHTLADTGEVIGVWGDEQDKFQNIDTDGATADLSASISQPQNILFADLSTATSASINDIRLAYATQHILERDARSGTRYVESLKSRWGVTSPDFRLQRAEFLGGGKTAVSITPVQQQSAQTTPVADDKLGNLAAYGTASGTHSWSKSFVEHGVVIILGNLRGDISYSQGIDRYWKKSTRYEFVYPEMANLGEQAVEQGEIWSDGTNDAIVFGYQGRYDEHRFMSSKLTGLMRPDAASTLASWHLSEDFATAPTLGDTFIKANTTVPLDRAVAIPSEPHMIADFFHNIKAALPLPTYGVPGLTRL